MRTAERVKTVRPLHAVQRPDDERLAAQFFARTRDGLESVYRAYGRLLYSVARSILGNDEDAQDCVHDTLLRVWQRGDTYRAEAGPLRAYLAACVRNDAVTRVRTASRRRQIERTMVRGEPLAYDFEGGDVVERGRLGRAVKELPAEQRAVLSLAYAQHLTQTEIASRLEVPLGTVKGRLRLALRKLQAALHE